MNLKIEPLDLHQADISGSKWKEVKAEELDIDNVSLAKTRINNVNMHAMNLNDVNMSEITISDANMTGVSIKCANLSHAVINYVNLFGTEFHNVILPMEGDRLHKPDGRYKPISFHNCILPNTQFNGCDLTNVELTDCDITGFRINGILISDLLQER